MVTPFVDVLVPVALDQTYSYRVPADLELAPGDVVSVPLGAREAIGVVWAENVTINPRPPQPLKDVEHKLDVPPLKPELRKFVDWVSELHAEPARHGAAHVPAHGRASRTRARAGRRAARRPAAEADDGGARARAGAARRRPGAHQGRGGARGRRLGRRHRRPGRRGHAGDAGAAAGAGGAPPDPDLPRRISPRRSARRATRCAPPSPRAATR